MVGLAMMVLACVRQCCFNMQGALLVETVITGSYAHQSVGNRIKINVPSH